MGKVAILKILQENQDREFIIFLEIKEDNGRSVIEIEGTLSANNLLCDRYKIWKNAYQDLISCSRNHDEWEIHSIPTNIAYSDLVADCRKKWQSLEKTMKQWLASSNNPQWNRIREELAKNLDSKIDEERIRLIIKTKNIDLWRLPWHVWDLLKDYPDLGIGCSWSEHYQPPKLERNRDLVNILAIFGETTNINLEPDKEAIQQLSNTNLEILEQSTSGELIAKIRNPNGWDILFFCGHSQSEKDRGRIYINDRDSLTIEEFKNALQEAIAFGLKIAIFNSCDGLALARELVAEFHIPVVIVMQEIVPDKVAQFFVREFLSEYSNGKSLYTAVRIAQNRLEQFSEFPGVTLLPLIVQNDAIKLPNWSDLLSLNSSQEILSEEPRDLSQVPNRLFRSVILSSLAVSAIVMGIRWLGALQPLELYAYDRLVQLQSKDEEPDSRILVVTVDDEDIKYQDSQNMVKDGSLSDEALAKALSILETLNPTTIALDIYREHGFTSEIVNRLEADNRFFTICKIQELKNNQYGEGVEPPSEFPSERLVFSDVPIDNHKIVRRQFLNLTSLNADDPCGTEYSLSFLAAQHYLFTQYNNLKATYTPHKEWQLDNLVLKKLKNHSAGYQKLDDAGYQILLKYRRIDPIERVAYSISLKKLLEEGVSKNLRDRIQKPIILIGTIDKSYKDYHFTPHRIETPGVFLQAQMTSQILSAVLDKRSLIWYWNSWLEAIWIGFWAIIGGFLGIKILNPRRLLFTIISAFLGIFAICWIVFAFSGWIPLIPPVLTLLITTFIVRKIFIDRYR